MMKINWAKYRISFTGGLGLTLAGSLLFISCIENKKEKERCNRMNLIDYFYPKNVCQNAKQCHTISLHIDKIQNKTHTVKNHYQFINADLLSVKRLKSNINKSEQYEYIYEVSPKKVVLKSLRHQTKTGNWVAYQIQKGDFLTCKPWKHRVLEFTIPSNEVPTTVTNQISHILIDSTQYNGDASSMLMNFGKAQIKNNLGHFQSDFTEVFIKGFGQTEYIETVGQDTVQHKILHSIRKE